MKPTVVFMTDFGSGGGAVLAGVVKSVDPELGVYDFDHNIEPYNMR
ncbi:MAG: SAM-dependent chlorinase/fluorinase, partial [Atopobiaceae bacterium]|nr:SAM-dependent chlorinase/fluorinase [Atopobiaceae bacterium]